MTGEWNMSDQAAACSCFSLATGRVSRNVCSGVFPKHQRPWCERRSFLAAWLRRWEKRYPKLTDWVETHIAETFTFYRLPRQHHKHLKSTNLLERLNEEIRRRTCVVRIFPNEAACLRLVRALCAEIHENWIEDHRYLDMSLLKEQKKEQLRAAA